MAIQRYSLRETPILKGRLETGDTVTVAVYDSDGNAVGLDSNSATEQPAGTGVYKYELDFTTKPTSGENHYLIIFTGTYQNTKKEFSWDEDISEFNGGIHIDTVIGTAGQGFPIGTEDTPSDNLTDALAIAARINTNKFKIKGSLTLDQPVSGYEFDAVQDFRNDVIVLNNQDISDCTFVKLKLTGQANGEAWFENCSFENVTDLNGYINECSTVGLSVNTLVSGDKMYFSASGAPGADLDLQGGAYTFAIGSCDGFVNIKNVSDASAIVFMSSRGAIITIDSTCTAGVIIVSGDAGGWTDNSGPGCIVLRYTGSLDTDTELLRKVTDGEWELVAPNKLYYYQKGTRTGPGAGVILREFDCYDIAGNPTITNIARVE